MIYDIKGASARKISKVVFALPSEQVYSSIELQQAARNKTEKRRRIKKRI
jgi:hypothetical protein